MVITRLPGYAESWRAPWRFSTSARKRGFNFSKQFVARPAASGTASAHVLLRRSEGASEFEVAKALGVSLTTVSLWSRRFELEGLAGLKDRPRPGRKPWLAQDNVRRVVTQVVQPPQGRKKWSTRSMAAAAGLSHQSVHRIWKANDLTPHLRRTFKISNDPQFEKKFWDVIGLYLNPPHKALVLCCDEKSQCQALERTQPGLPLGSATSALRRTITNATARLRYSRR